MAYIDPQHFLQELRDNRRTGDLIKARFLIDLLDRLKPDVQARVFSEIESDNSEFGSILLGYIASRSVNSAIPRDELKKALVARMKADPGLARLFLTGEEFRDKRLFEMIAAEAAD